MANYQNKANLHVFRFPKGGTNLAGCIADIFDIDSDFKENQENFREDTTSIGYLTESQRCAVEVADKVMHLDGYQQIKAILDIIPNYSNGVSQFVVGNSNHSGDYEFHITSTNDEYIVSLAYVG